MNKNFLGFVLKNKLRAGIALGFGLSGVAALIYEVVWFRPLQLIFGSTTLAVSTMLASMLAGFALGSYLFRHRADSSKNPLLLFAVLEFGIGVYGLAIIQLFGLLTPVYLALQAVPVLQFIVLSLVLIVPATLIGATWPVANRAYISRTENLGRDTGILYSFNSLGNMLGGFMAGFVLIPVLGISNSCFFAAFLNIVAAAMLLACSKRWSNEP